MLPHSASYTHKSLVKTVFTSKGETTICKNTKNGDLKTFIFQRANTSNRKVLGVTETDEETFNEAMKYYGN